MDGCGVVVFALPASRPWRVAYARLADAARRSHEIPSRIVHAMQTRPFLFGGSDRFDSCVIEETEGRVIAKIGAEGVHSVAHRRRGHRHRDQGRGWRAARAVSGGDLASCSISAPSRATSRRARGVLASSAAQHARRGRRRGARRCVAVTGPSPRTRSTNATVALVRLAAVIAGGDEAQVRSALAASAVTSCRRSGSRNSSCRAISLPASRAR